MNTLFRSIIAFIVVVNVGMVSSFAQFKNRQEAIDYVNDRFSHSIIQKIDDDGLVTIKAPSQRITFPIGKSVFNYNDLNGDSRVRVACASCIKFYENREYDRTESRQSFSCDSEDEAFEVIRALEYIKSTFPVDAATAGLPTKKLNLADTTLGYTSVAEAVNLVNKVLLHSFITGIDDKGVMTINAPSDNYKIDLSKAEFMVNDLGDDPKLRIYGDFCIRQIDDDGDEDFISRESFSTKSRFKCYKAIKALYYIKSAYSSLQPDAVPQLPNVRRNHLTSYKTLDEAITFINNRLRYSVILGIDSKGMLSINAPSEVYRINMKKAKFNYTDRNRVNVDWFGIRIESDNIDGVLVECRNCIEKYSDPRDYDITNEQTFQCESEQQVREVLKALTFIKEKI